MKTDILGVNIDSLTFSEALEVALSFLDAPGGHMIFTPNPEMIMAAHRSPELKTILNNASLVIPDGIGVVMMSKINKIKIRERVTGYDFTEALFDRLKGTDKSFYFLGSKPEVAELAKEKVEEKFLRVKIAGTHDGYFDAAEEIKILEELNRLEPEVILVGFDGKKACEWISGNLGNLSPKTKILIGVGGSFDGFSGNFPRAPKLVRKLCLEWLYRLIKEPSRRKRQMQLPVFVVYALLYRLGKWRK